MDLKIVIRDNVITKGYSTRVYMKNGTEYLNPRKVHFSSNDKLSIDDTGFVVGLKEGEGVVTLIYRREECTATIQVVKEKKVMYIGHRGARPLSDDEIVIPNTSSAFQVGAKRNTYGIETDLRVSPDHVFYCHHDGEVTTTQANFIEAELKENEVEVGSDINKIDFSILSRLNVYYTIGGRNVKNEIALLTEYLRICKEYNKKCILEFKWTNGINNYDCSYVNEVVEIVKRKEMYENVFFMTSMRPCLEHLRANYSDASMQLLTGKETTNQDSIEWCVKYRASLDAYYPSLNKNFIKQIHDNNLYVNAWTVNEKSACDELIEMGVDMITSDLLQADE
ncbi:MAG: glycerophosphodiester phosphodiesterase [Bacilli bacterium]|nr:glycerophosphodiester phosphodiesterase [Bacilli bacterium]